MKKHKSLVKTAVVFLIVLAATLWISHVPALKQNVQPRSYFSANAFYTVSCMPNKADTMINTETRVGIDEYWKRYHSVGKCIEAQMQVSKDGEIVVLSGDLSDTDAEILYGKKNASVDALTLAQLQKVNLLYNVQDENGEYIYRSVSDLAKPSVAVMSLSEYLDYFNDGSKMSALHILRFQDESKVSGWTGVINKLFNAVSESDMLKNAVLRIENRGAIRYIDEVHPDLQRAASKSECSSLRLFAKLGIEQKETPYVLVYDSDRLIGNDQFMHYARNCGLAVIVSVPAQSAKTLTMSAAIIEDWYKNGLNAIATDDLPSMIDLLQDAA